MKRLAPILFLLTTCTIPQPPQPNEREQLAIDATREVWAESGLRDCSRFPWGLIHEDEKGFEKRCWVGSDAAASCYDINGGGIIVLAPGVEMDKQGEPVIHEMIHALQYCVEGKIDYAHEDTRLWKAVNPESSVQTRAEEIFRERSHEELDDFDAGVSTQD